MSDWLNTDPTPPADGGFSLGDDMAPLSNDLLYGDDLAIVTEPAPAADYGDPYASQAGFAAPAAPAQHGSSLSVQAPMLDDLQPSINTMGSGRDDLSSLVLDVEVPVEVCFGNASLTVEEFLEIGPGSVVELDRAIEQPIELKVRGKIIATGQLVTINGNYGLRITDTVEQNRAF